VRILIAVKNKENCANLRLRKGNEREGKEIEGVRSLDLSRSSHCDENGAPEKAGQDAGRHLKGPAGA
jgi:hypothetical protein